MDNRAAAERYAEERYGNGGDMRGVKTVKPGHAAPEEVGIHLFAEQGDLAKVQEMIDKGVAVDMTVRRGGRTGAERATDG